MPEPHTFLEKVKAMPSLEAVRALSLEELELVAGGGGGGYTDGYHGDVIIPPPPPFQSWNQWV